LFGKVDSMVFWAAGEPVFLLVPTRRLAGIFDEQVASIDHANRWHVHVYFSRRGKSELIPDKYPNKPVHDLTEFALPWIEPGVGARPPELALDENEIRLALRKHRKREWRLRQGKIEQVLGRDGRLACEVPRCRFDFSITYGELGERFAHVHHNTPLATGEGPVQTSLDDLTVVCPNCHAMIHRWMRQNPNRICPLAELVVTA